MTDIIDLNIDDKIAVPFPSRTFGMQDHHFQVGSVDAFWRKDGQFNEEQIAQRVERARGRGEDLYFVFPLGFAITAHRQEPVTYVHLKLGAQVRIDGHVFMLTEANNQNIKLVEVTD